LDYRPPLEFLEVCHVYDVPPTHFWPRTQNMWLWQQSQPDDRHYGGSFSWGTIHGRKSYVKAAGRSGMTISACARCCTKGAPIRAAAAVRVNSFRSPDQFMHNIVCLQRLCKASPFSRSIFPLSFDEFLILRFRASNQPPSSFEWLDLKANSLDCGAILTRISREYDRRFRNGNGGDNASESA
jgi:hypothetical protein